MSIRPDEKCDLGEVLEYGSLAAFNCSPNREVVFAVREKSTPCRSGAPVIKHRTPQSYRLFETAGEYVVHLADVENEVYSISYIQSLSEHILLAGGRSQRRAEGDWDMNGRVYSHQGELQREILLGDGVNNIQTSENGTIWTSYFDEGILGNLGWDNPVGVSGLVAWSTKGKKIYEYQSMEGLASMADCYAMNVFSNHVVWCCYYADFPLVKIKNGRVEDYWKAPVKGCHAFAVYKNYVLFFGGYHEKNTLILVTLGENHQAAVTKRIPLLLSEIAEVHAQGDTMFFLSKNKIYELNVRQCL